MKFCIQTSCFALQTLFYLHEAIAKMLGSTSTGTFKGDIRFSKTEKSVGGLSADPKQSF